MCKMIGKLIEKTILKGKLNTTKIYPELEDLEVIPSGTEQNFKSKKYGYDNVTVKAIDIKLQEKTIEPTKQVQEVVADTNYDGIRKVTISAIPDNFIVPTDNIAITKNGNYNIKDYETATVNVPIPEPNLGTKTITENGTYNASDEGLDGFSNVEVNVASGGGSSAKITSGYYLFANNARIDNLSEILKLIEGVTNCSFMFYDSSQLTEVDLSNLNTSKVTDMTNMFSGCMALNNLNINAFDTSNVTTMYNMFSNCRALTNLDLKHFNTPKLTNTNSMFYYCQKLTDLDLSSFDMSKVTNIRDMFSQCQTLVNLKFGKNLGKGYTQKSAGYSYYTLAFNSCPKLSHESLMDIINNLYDLNVTYGSSSYKQTLNLGTTNKAKLTADEIAIATNKGWNVT